MRSVSHSTKQLTTRSNNQSIDWSIGQANYCRCCNCVMRSRLAWTDIVTLSDVAERIDPHSNTRLMPVFDSQSAMQDMEMWVKRRLGEADSKMLNWNVYKLNKFFRVVAVLLVTHTVYRYLFHGRLKFLSHKFGVEFAENWSRLCIMIRARSKWVNSRQYNTVPVLT